MLDLLSLTMEETENLMISLGEEKYRAKQIFKWVNKGTKKIDDMTDLSKNLREKLKKNTFITDIKIKEKIISSIDNTIKYLFLLEDSNMIESVRMEYKHGLTACISTQAGCAMGCKFCASNIGGLIRNLSAGEMADQILTIQQDSNERISNVVLMGTGEPLNNLEEVIKLIRIINNENGLRIGNRHITVSTCGIIPEIIKLADYKIPVNLAISLHAPADELRQKIMPAAQKYKLHQLMEACKYYLQKTNRRITFEYALIKGINDGLKEAQQLADLIKGLLCHVNLIPVNKVPELGYEKSDEHQIKKFQSLLMSKGIEATIRREMGGDIHAACGQLRRKHLKQVNR